MASLGSQLLDTTPKWLGLTLASSACAFIAVGAGLLFNQIVEFSITPFTLLLHLLLGISLSAWIVNLRIKMASDRKPLLGIGIVVAAGSVWSSLQQWFGYLATGVTNDITLVAGAMVLDAAGGCVTYVLYHLNVLKK